MNSKRNFMRKISMNIFLTIQIRGSLQKCLSIQYQYLIIKFSYQLGEVIGTGSFGRVLMCLNKENGQLMACKQVPVLNFSKGNSIKIHQHPDVKFKIL